MSESQRKSVYKLYRKFLYSIGGLQQSMDYVGVCEKSMRFIQYLGDLQPTIKGESNKWFVGFFQEIAWFVFDNPRNEKWLHDDGKFYTLNQFIEEQIKCYSPKSNINEWIK